MQQGKQKPMEGQEITPAVRGIDNQLKAANSPFLHGPEKNVHMEAAKDEMRKFNTLKPGQEDKWVKDMATMASKSPDAWLPFLRENLNHQTVGENVWKNDVSGPSAEVLNYMANNGMLNPKTAKAMKAELAEFNKERAELRAAAMASAL